MDIDRFVKNGLQLGIRFYNLEKSLGDEKMVSIKEITNAIKNNDRIQIGYSPV